MADNQKKKAEAPKPKPNIVLVAKDKDGKIDTTKALEKINTTSGVIELPKREEQAKPFFLEEAEKVKASMPHLYKTPINKGDK